MFHDWVLMNSLFAVLIDASVLEIVGVQAGVVSRLFERLPSLRRCLSKGFRLVSWSVEAV